VGRISIFKQRLPCVGLFLYAALGVVVGRYVLLPGGLFAGLAAAGFLAAFLRPLRLLLPVAIALTFAAAQAWQYRESSAVRLAAQLTTEAQACEATIQVLEAPHRSATSERCRFTARVESLRIGGRELPAGCPALVLWTGEPPVYGGRYAVRASIFNSPPQRNPGAFDYSAWLANSGIHSQIEVFRAKDAKLLEVGGNPIVRFAIASCAWIEHTISLGIEGTPEAVLIKAMTVGDTSDAPDSLKVAFRETGTFHLFSVSGLHVGIVAILLWAVLGACGVEQRRSVLIIIPCLFFYALVTGLSAASLRSAIMLSILAMGLLVDRSPVALNNVGAAGVALLAWDSSQLFNSGFQLSFGAVVAICLIALPIQNFLETFVPPGTKIPSRIKPRIWRRFLIACLPLREKYSALVLPDPLVPPKLIPPVLQRYYHFGHNIILLVAVSFAAWVASLPLVIYYFHLISFSSILANLIAVPLSTGILALSAVALVAGAFSPWLAEVFNQANFFFTKILLITVNAFAAVPGSSVYVGPPLPPGTTAQIVVLDAGSGGATVLFAGHQTWLIDGGSEFFAGAVTVPFLRWNGVNRLDTLVLTHGDAQHLGGFDTIERALRPRRILDSGLPDRSPIHKRLLAETPPDVLQFAQSTALFGLGPFLLVEVLYPTAEMGGLQADDKAMVLRFEAGNFSALLMSDAGIATEQWLLAHAARALPCNVIIMGRHRTGFSGDPEFLRAAHPQAIIATAAAFPAPERIRPEWAATVKSMGIALFRQDETGAVTVTSHAGSYTVSPYLSTGGPPQTFPDVTHSLR